MLHCPNVRTFLVNPRNHYDSRGFLFIWSKFIHCNGQGWHRDAIERQLAHAERDSVRAAYNYAEHLPERERMMQAWADHLDAWVAGADVVPIRGNAALSLVTAFCWAIMVILG
jgi:hypothetical protein